MYIYFFCVCVLEFSNVVPNTMPQMRVALVTRAAAERRAVYPACMERFRVPALSSTTPC